MRSPVSLFIALASTQSLVAAVEVPVLRQLRRCCAAGDHPDRIARRSAGHPGHTAVSQRAGHDGAGRDRGARDRPSRIGDPEWLSQREQSASLPTWIASGSLDVGGFTIPTFDLAVMLAAVLAVAGRCLLGTCGGLHIKAVSQDRDAARLSAISPDIPYDVLDRVAVAACSSSDAGMARFYFSIEVGLIGFSAAVVGGLGSMPGAIIGSLIAGLDTLVQAVVAELLMVSSSSSCLSSPSWCSGPPRLLG